MTFQKPGQLIQKNTTRSRPTSPSVGCPRSPLHGWLRRARLRKKGDPGKWMTDQMDGRR